MKKLKSAFNYVAQLAKEEANWSVKTILRPINATVQAFLSVLPR